MFIKEKNREPQVFEHIFNPHFYYLSILTVFIAIISYDL